ncbi:GNAT family N-acetyltransferase [Aurantimonas sp. Leaf443]|uniref:GNAT family N-acetyltransferase n=1 Tax=Aurantimonas sp. Leaf443 TaxID=1736378 RepID=UPI000701C045|nr:GNAT family N-acetyltransferase [Aurantimonas sp. Leaf443]KQT83418.1 GCN5 family acetyltransferase [Aurantimonas sp. Leaf443]
MSRFFVRTAGVKDLGAVSALLRETWHATYDAIYGPERVAEITASWHSVEALRPRLTRPNSEFLVADDGTRLAGMAYAGASGEGRSVALHQLYVRPDCQGQGIGADLLSEIAGCFPLARVLRVEVEEANTAAVAFYRHAGFALVGRTDACGTPGSGLPAAIYEKPLG